MSVINENEIAHCVRKAINDYFSHLDGEKPCSIYAMVIQSVEKPLIELTMKHADGNITLAANLLGINRNTLRKKIKQFNL